MGLHALCTEGPRFATAFLGEMATLACQCPTVEKVKNAFKSHLITALTGGLALSGLVIFQLVPLSLLAAGIAAEGYYIYTYYHSIRDEAVLSVICYEHRMNPEKARWYTAISEKIILGAIPLKGHKDRLISEGVTAVLSVTQQAELHYPYLSATPLTPADWQKDARVTQKIIEVFDFHGLGVDQLVEGVKFLEERETREGKVYVHCKAGKGRSVSVVVAYLMKKGASLTQSMELVKALRPQIYLNAAQIASLKKYQIEHCTVKA